MKYLLVVSALAAAAVAGAQSAPLRTWSDPALQFTFSYPAELVPAKTDPGSGCSRTLLTAALGSDPNQDAPDDGSPAPPAMGNWATLTLSDMGPSCIPRAALKKPKIMDRMLAGMAGDPTQVLGLMPMEQPVGYPLLGQHAFLAAAQGEPVAASGLQPANGAEVLAVIAAHVGDHVLVWHIASNDVALLNRILAGRVALAAGPAQPLYPGHVGE